MLHRCRTGDGQTCGAGGKPDINLAQSAACDINPNMTYTACIEMAAGTVVPFHGVLRSFMKPGTVVSMAGGWIPKDAYEAGKLLHGGGRLVLPGFVPSEDGYFEWKLRKGGTVPAKGHFCAAGKAASCANGFSVVPYTAESVACWSSNDGGTTKVPSVFGMYVGGGGRYSTRVCFVWCVRMMLRVGVGTRGLYQQGDLPLTSHLKCHLTSTGTSLFSSSEVPRPLRASSSLSDRSPCLRSSLFPHPPSPIPPCQVHMRPNRRERG